MRSPEDSLIHLALGQKTDKCDLTKEEVMALLEYAIKMFPIGVEVEGPSGTKKFVNVRRLK